MDKVLLDTDMLSQLTKGKNAKVTAKAAYHGAIGRFTISVFSLLEVIEGCHQFERPDKVLSLVENQNPQNESEPFHDNVMGVFG